MPIADIDHTRISYTQTGSGSDVVMVHGLAANLAFWNLRIVPPLAGAFRIATYDLRGHGRSDMPLSGYTMRDMVGDLHGLLDHLAIERAHLVGHSFGGGVVLNYALAHPKRVLSLSLVDAVVQPCPRGPGPNRRCGRFLRARLRRRGIVPGAGALEDDLGLLQALADGCGRHLGPGESRDAFFVPFGLWNGARRSARRWWELLHATTARDDIGAIRPLEPDELRQLGQPCLANYGQLSRHLPMCWVLKASLPDCRVRIVPGVGHFHPLVKPDLFIQTLRWFLHRIDHRDHPVGSKARIRNRSRPAASPGRAGYHPLCAPPSEVGEGDRRRVGSDRAGPLRDPTSDSHKQAFP
jgi:pimeloyl-ACP methyl ester carboxylesterase